MSEKFELIAAEQASLTQSASVKGLCAALGVSRSGYYDWHHALPSARACRRAKVTTVVVAAFGLGRGTYGARRVHAILTRSDDPDVAGAGLDLVRDIMREKGLRACQPRAYRVTTTPGDPAGEPVIVDHLGRDFTASAPGTKLVGDIT